ncbi:hypothetical protein BaRGS_00010387, partial [Batillaria attramentaria]
MNASTKIKFVDPLTGLPELPDYHFPKKKPTAKLPTRSQVGITNRWRHTSEGLQSDMLGCKQAYRALTTAPVPSDYTSNVSKTIRAASATGEFDDSPMQRCATPAWEPTPYRRSKPTLGSRATYDRVRVVGISPQSARKRHVISYGWQ